MKTKKVAVLDAMADFVDILRLAHGAIHHLGQNVHPGFFISAFRAY